jgi:hypothetical protein
MVDHSSSQREGALMNNKLKKQLITAGLILLGILIVFAIIGQVA